MYPIHLGTSLGSVPERILMVPDIRSLLPTKQDKSVVFPHPEDPSNPYLTNISVLHNEK